MHTIPQLREMLWNVTEKSQHQRTTFFAFMQKRFRSKNATHVNTQLALKVILTVVAL